MDFPSTWEILVMSVSHVTLQSVTHAVANLSRLRISVIVSLPREISFFYIFYAIEQNVKQFFKESAGSNCDTVLFLLWFACLLF